MSKQSFSAVILAAGKATRFKSDRPKVLHRLAGLPLGEYILRAAAGAEPDQIYMVVGHRAEEVRKAFERPGLRFIEQQQQLGTGHALIVAREQLESCPSPAVIVLVGDAPLLRPETLRELAGARAKAGAAATILTAELENPQGYGRIVRGAGSRVRAVVEEKVATPAQKRIHEVNAGILCFSREKLLRRLDELSRDNPQKEYLLTDLVAILNRHGERLTAFTAEDSRRVLGVNDRAELARAEKILRLQKAEALMREGVTMVNPEATYVDFDARVGGDTVLEPGVSLLGRTEVGSSCTIRAYSTIDGSVLGDQVTVRPYSMITGCEIASGVIIGPFAHLRDGAVVEQDARIGNFVEVKKSRVGRRTKAWHLTYLGDATLGQDVNVGAGTVTCNYDGKEKKATVIEDNVFIGSGTMLVAPVKVGQRAYVAAGSTITENVPPESLAIGRAHQVNKEGWVRQREDEQQSHNPEFSAATRESGAITILDLDGRLTMTWPTEEFSRKVRGLLGAGHRRVLVNMSAISYLDSAGLGALVGAMTAFRKAQGEFKLACVPAKVLKIMETARLSRAFEIFADEPSGVASFQRRESA